MTPQLSSMSAEDKRIAIAEVHARFDIAKGGYELYQQPKGTEGYKCDLSGCWILRNTNDSFMGVNYDDREKVIPGLIVEYAKRHNYLNSLDACHEMEKALKGASQLTAYENALRRIHIQSDSDEKWYPEQLVSTCLFHATAAQRADAFLLALNLATK